MGVQHQHLDFKSTTANLRKDQDYLATLATTEKDQQRKAKEAAAYRAKLLGKQSDVEMSPGHLREKASMMRAKRQQDAEKETERQMDGKATFMQCVFNLANILMVRQLIYALGWLCVFPLI
jgi:hypothetical protein